MVDAEKKSSLKKMLSDAVPLLCRSSLGIYNSKLSVEAIICITVNNDDLVHISFNEILTADGNTVSHTWCKCETPNVDTLSGEPERCKETSDASSSSDLGRLNKRSAADYEDGGTTFDDQNLSYDAVDASCVDLGQWGEVKPNDLGDSTAKKRRNRRSSTEKTSRQNRQVNGYEKRILDESSHSRHDEVEATMPVSQNSMPGLMAPDIKVEQLENEDCLFVKMETDINNDDYSFSTMEDIAAFDSSFPVPMRKRLRTQTSFESCDAVAKHSFTRGTTSRTYSHVAQRQSHVRRSGNAAHDELNRLQGNHSSSLAEYQVTQSTTSVVRNFLLYSSCCMLMLCIVALGAPACLIYYTGLGYSDLLRFLV